MATPNSPATDSTRPVRTALNLGKPKRSATPVINKALMSVIASRIPSTTNHSS